MPDTPETLPERGDGAMASQGLSWEGEHCQSCGRGYSDVWSVPDDLWVRVVGSLGGLRCTNCFINEANSCGFYVNLPTPTYEPRMEADLKREQGK